MTSDKKTIAVYDLKVDEYSKTFAKAKSDPALSRFISKLPKGAHVLDLGCGPGTHAAAMYEQGCRVTAIDASAAMVALAQSRKGVEARQAEFDELCESNIYDGIWANFSLLHVSRTALPVHLAQIVTALKPRGIFHIGMKTGSGERRDHLGRKYTFYSAEELQYFLEAAGFRVLEKRRGESAGLAGTVDPWIEILSKLQR